MAIKGKTQLKVYVSPEAKDVLVKMTEARGTTLSGEVEAAILEVILPELRDIAPELDLQLPDEK